MRFRATVVDPAFHPHHEGVEYHLEYMGGIPNGPMWIDNGRDWTPSGVPELLEWCTERFGEQGERWLYEPDFIVIFHKKSDAVMFRLAWIEDDSILPT